MKKIKICFIIIAGMAMIFMPSDHLSAARLVCRNVFTQCSPKHKTSNQSGEGCPPNGGALISDECIPDHRPSDAAGWAYFLNSGQTSRIYRQSDLHNKQDEPWIISENDSHSIAKPISNFSMENATSLNAMQCKRESCEPAGVFVKCISGSIKGILNLIPTPPARTSKSTNSTGN